MIWHELPSRGPWHSPPSQRNPPSASSSLPLPPPVPPVTTSSNAPQSTSRNSLFDVDWAPVTPNTRSRSSTLNSSASQEECGRQSWLDKGPFTSARATAPPFERRETVTPYQAPTPVMGSKHDSGFEWLPHSPISPQRSTTPPIASCAPGFGPADAVQPTPRTPSPSALPRLMFPPTPSSPPRPPSRPSPVEFPSSEALPPTAGHSSNPLLDTRRAPSLRMSPTPTFLLGEGRHASVYLASCEPSRSNGAVLVEKRPRRRRLCAAKRLFPDRESQVAGLGEAFILAKLSGHGEGVAGIIGLYGVRDERDGVDPPLQTAPAASSSFSRSSQRISSSGSHGLPSPLRRTGDGDDIEDSPSSGTSAKDGTRAAARSPNRNSDTIVSSSHGRSKLSLLSHALDPPLSSTRRRAVSSTSRDGTPCSTPGSSAQGGLAPPFSLSPRIDLLLEFCPFGHTLQFAKAHPERLNKQRWFEWAKQLAAAVKWAHEKNVLHGDIKPQNVLIAPDLTIRLADWGNSLFLPSPSAPAHLFPTDPHGLGTPSYSPPEYVKQLPSPFSYPSDIFSLGITMSVLITAAEPYEGIRAVERMMRVSSGEWWDYEERKRLGSLSQGAEDQELSLSRNGSIRSNRSGRSSIRGSLRASLRREASVESIRSFMSASGIGEQGPRDWPALARTLLSDPDCSAAEIDAAVADAMPSLPHLPRTSGSTTSLPSMDVDSALQIDVGAQVAHFSHSPMRVYAGTSTPVQYFLSARVDDFSDSGHGGDATGEGDEDVVPLAVRDLIRQMTRPNSAERPSAEEVWLSICRIGVIEGNWPSKQEEFDCGDGDEPMP